ncbi:BlaI/MecI/CopY family transcriptional regulator [Streptomyces hirsutus]|uniref:BlaI/MecI/CopY family transcriptional regulator n=1 Tax=Streptomyces hirsutus TaxID=35620 RepID=A0ABZ1H061_9ACTN|nr:BlaI/MecI/CopY family transcriptional regulator [Streptomyces hirsutus]WSD10654.1 BlaI/MecI/CopY family transcriptional regulator [Streptomyces hirsutus]WTD15999.1 BlaI/MecI/CopY family transcriptional regulator [Streptomyces hirsutus]
MAAEPEEPTTQSLQSQYAAQFADHLAANREEQARLRKRLEQLEADEAWLIKALETVSAPAEAGAGAQAPEGEPAPPQDNTSGPTEATESAEPSEATDVEASAAVPQQRQDQPAEAPAKKTTAKKATAKKPGAKKTAKQAPAAKAGEPSLGELLLTVLGKHAGQPRTAGEVTGDLEREYPERARDINTVRNTLERLVAKSRVERTKQKNTVLYTAVTEPAPAADDAAAEASPAAETAGAAETANTEKVPAQA